MTFLRWGNGRRPSRHVPLTGSSSKEQWQTMTLSIGSTAPDFEQDSTAGRTPVDNATVRTACVIGPDKQIKAMASCPMSTGRNFDEILRLLDSCQLTAGHKVATPANWQSGEDVIIVPAVKDDEAKERFPEGWKAPKPYLRVVPQPSD